MAGVLQEQAHGHVHGALAHAHPVRLRIWRGYAPLARAAADAGSHVRDITLLYQQEAPLLRRRLARRLGPDLAADVVQSAFVRLLGIGEGLGRVDVPRSYLGRIAENLANDDAKSARRRAEPLEIDCGACDLAAPDFQKTLETRDMLRRIEVAIQTLPDRTRDIFTAHRFEGLTYQEIAERMGVSVKTVEKHISAALCALHRAVGPSS